MCGIFALLNNNDTLDDERIKEYFNKAKHRGPENSKILKISDNLLYGFHRLAINGLNEASNQPLVFKDCILICNGEIYNYNTLYSYMNSTPTTNSDCEVIIHMYKKYGIDYTLNNLDGVFSFVLYDQLLNKIYIARDPYGVRPLFMLQQLNNQHINSLESENILAFASELKQLIDIKITLCHPLFNTINILQFKPGHYMSLDYNNNNWYINNIISYSTTGFLIMKLLPYIDILKMIKQKFTESVIKRIVGTSDRPVACLLSGGLDSSLVTSLVSRYIPNLQTFSIGLEGSEDLKYAKKVADFLHTRHHEVIIKKKDFFDIIPEVIEKIESYDTTTIRASIGNYLISKYISENSDAKVIFNGDGSDELMGGYLYFNKCPDMYEFDCECRRLLKDICYYDVLRSDRSISTNGLEPRTPFLDRGWVQFYLSLPREYRYHPGKNKCEKYLIREAFDDGTYLPKDILFRRKEAFSDGVANIKDKTANIIEEQLKVYLKTNPIDLTKYLQNNLTLEQSYYKYIYDTLYPDCDNLIPYYWMPKYIDATDSSARTLSIY